MVTVLKTKLFSVIDMNTNEASLSIVTSDHQLRRTQIVQTQGEEIFSRKIVINNEEEVELDFLLIRLDQSCFAWCGRHSAAASLDSIVVGFVGSKTGPVATSILGNRLSSDEDEASSMRIAKKSNLIAVHFSSSIGADPTHEIRIFAEKCIIDALKS